MIALYRLFRVRGTLGDDAIKEECILAAEMQEQAREIPQVDILTSVGDGENDTAFFVDTDSVAHELVWRSFAEGWVPLSIGQKKGAGLNGKQWDSRLRIGF